MLDKAFRQHKQWGARDRRFVAEAVYDIVRWWRLLEESAQTHLQDPHVIEKVIAAYFVYVGQELPAWYPSLSISVQEIEDNLLQNKSKRALAASIPSWLDERGEKELGSKWEKELEALNTPAQVVLRTNTLKISRAKLQELLLAKQIEVEAIPANSEALLLKKRQSLQNLQEYQLGYFEIQDAGSQTIAPFLNATPGSMVIDACAGAGGKTLHLASLMQNNGKIIAMDVEQRKLNNLKERAQRAGASIIQTSLITDGTIQNYYSQADYLLLDVPCSGLGVLKRNPDAKWKLSNQEIENTRHTQATILEKYSSMLKNGGTLVYATCSILPSENQEQITHFLHKAGGAFVLEETSTIWPSDGFDGFYMARLKKI